MPSNIPKPPVTRIPGSPLKQGAPIKTPYHYVSADHKDFQEFVDDLLPILRKLGIYATYDPSLHGQDHIGIVLSPEPIDPQLLAKELAATIIAGEAEDIVEEYQQDYIKDFIPPPAMYKRRQKVRVGALATRIGTVKSMEYTKKGWEVGWYYTLTDANTKKVFTAWEREIRPLKKG